MKHWKMDRIFSLFWRMFLNDFVLKLTPGPYMETQLGGECLVSSKGSLDAS